jgi:hypothetical protein
MTEQTSVERSPTTSRDALSLAIAAGLDKLANRAPFAESYPRPPDSRSAAFFVFRVGASADWLATTRSGRPRAIKVSALRPIYNEIIHLTKQVRYDVGVAAPTFGMVEAAL